MKEHNPNVPFTCKIKTIVQQFILENGSEMSQQVTKCNNAFSDFVLLDFILCVYFYFIYFRKIRNAK